MTTKQWLAMIVVLVAVSAAAGGLADTMEAEYHPVWQEGDK